VEGFSFLLYLCRKTIYMNKYKGLCEITIGGEKRSLKFNMNTYAIFCEKMDIDIEDFGAVFLDKRKLKATITLIWAGLASYAESKGENALGYHEVSDYMDDISEEDYAIVLDTLLKSRELKNDVNNGLLRNEVESKSPDSKKK
jgi:hypothetical protein